MNINIYYFRQHGPSNHTLSLCCPLPLSLYGAHYLANPQSLFLPPISLLYPSPVILLHPFMPPPRVRVSRTHPPVLAPHMQTPPVPAPHTHAHTPCPSSAHAHAQPSPAPHTHTDSLDQLHIRTQSTHTHACPSPAPHGTGANYSRLRGQAASFLW